MIKLQKVREPRFLKSTTVRNFKNELDSHYHQKYELRSQKKFPRSTLREIINNISDELFKKSNNKCAYCERPLKDFINFEFDHFRPKSSASDLDGKIVADHYWWLALKWNNIYPSCRECNTNKKKLFSSSK